MEIEFKSDIHSVRELSIIELQNVSGGNDLTNVGKKIVDFVVDAVTIVTSIAVLVILEKAEDYTHSR